jgi:diguanylate cyclase (GGDEF)-like protein/PAS domain S-box-containing protein
MIEPAPYYRQALLRFKLLIAPCILPRYGNIVSRPFGYFQITCARRFADRQIHFIPEIANDHYFSGASILMRNKMPDRLRIFLSASWPWLTDKDIPTADQADIARLFNSLILFLSVLGTVFIVLQILLRGVIQWNNIILNLIFLGMGTGLRVWLRRGHVRQTGLLMALLTWLFFSFELYNLGTVFTVHLFGYFFAILLATIFVGEFTGLCFVLLTAISVYSLSRAEMGGFLSVNQPVSAINQQIVFTAMAVMLFVTVVLVRRSMLKALNDAHLELEQRGLAEADLRSLNASLDQRVKDRTTALELEIEKHKQTSAALLKNEEWFRTIADFTYSWEYFLSPQNAFLYVSPFCEKITGYPVSLFMQDPDFLVSIVHPQDRSLVAEHNHLSVETRQTCQDFDFRILNQDGQEHWIRHVCRPVFSTNGEYLGQRGSNRDITSRKNVELRLRQLSRAVEQSPSSIVITDINAHIEYVNPKFTEVTGYTPDEVIGENPRVLQSGNTPPASYVQLWNTITTGKEWRGEFQNQKKNGDFYWESAVIAPVVDAENQITHYVAIKEDITERKQIEKLLRDSEERFRSLFENSPFAYQSLDQNGFILDVNENLCELLGYTKAEFIGKPFSDFWAQGTSISKKSAHVDLQLLRKDHQPITVLLEVREQYDAHGRFLRNHCILTNVTEREQMQARLRQQNESMTALYESALEFLHHHDLDNLLKSLVDHASKLIEVDIAEIFTMKDDLLVAQNMSPELPFKVGDRFDRDRAVLAWRSVDTLQPAIMDDYSNWEHHLPDYDSLHIYAAASFPIVSNNQCLGVLDLGRDKPGHPFTADEIQMAKLFTQISALAIENANLNTSLLEQSIHDPLTGLYNRRYLFETIQREMSRSRRENYSISIVLLDVDRFKKLNDRYGHAAGDAVLRAMAAHFQKIVRSEDIICRIGGDEHIIVMHNTSPNKALERADQLRQVMEGLQVEHEHNLLHFTISMGVAAYPEHGMTIDEVIACADKALYASKKSGRNQVVLYTKPEPA